MLSADASPEPASRRVGPLIVRAGTVRSALRDVVGAVLRKSPMRVAFANTHLLYCAVRDPKFADELRHFYVVNDGVGMTLLARLACGRGFIENLNGTDFTPRMLRALPWGTRVMLVGARKEVALRASHVAARMWPQLDICGHYDGFDGSERALEDLNACAPDVVLAAMGNPKQEEWITRAAALRPGAVFVGVGALFDFIAGAMPRAPAELQRLHLEWAFRLMHEPRRLWRRYTIEVLVVLAALLRAPARPA